MQKTKDAITFVVLLVLGLGPSHHVAPAIRRRAAERIVLLPNIHRPSEIVTLDLVLHRFVLLLSNHLFATPALCARGFAKLSSHGRDLVLTRSRMHKRN